MLTINIYFLDDQEKEMSDQEKFVNDQYDQSRMIKCHEKQENFIISLRSNTTILNDHFKLNDQVQCPACINTLFKRGILEKKNKKM